MTSNRPYRDAFSWDTAATEIVGQTGAQFDPDVVEAFETVEPKLQKVHAEIAAA